MLSLHQAAANGQLEVVKLLVENSVDVNVRGKGGCTPIMYVAYRGYTDIVKLLIKQGAKVDAKDANGNTLIKYAASGGHMEMIEMLYKEYKVEINVTGQYGDTCVHYAANNGHVGMVKTLCNEYGFDINARDDSGWTAFHYIIMREKSTESIKTLLECKGIDVDALYKGKDSPLYQAVRIFKRPEFAEHIIRYVLEHEPRAVKPDYLIGESSTYWQNYQQEVASSSIEQPR